MSEGGLRVAAISMARVALLIAAVIALGLVRTSMSPLVYVMAVAVNLSALYLCARAGRDMRLWTVYVLAFVLFAHLRTLADETGLPAQYDYVIAAERFLFAHLRTLADETGLPAQYDYVIAAERFLFGGILPTLWLQEHLYVFGRAGPLESYTVLVYLSYFFAPHVAALAFWRLDSARWRPLVSALLLTFYLGLAVCLLLPTAPPWLAGQSGEIPRVFRIVKDVASGFSPDLYQQGYQVAGSNDVAAMPSLHMAITCVIALAAWRSRRLVGAVAWIYAASMALALVYLGEHYVVDLVAGLVTALVAWRVSTWWWSRREAHASERTLASVAGR